MLILIAGVTGNLGFKLASALNNRGHSVRGLARNKFKLSDEQIKELESFHEMSSWHDVNAIRDALKGVDAVACAYSPIPTFVLEAQLLLVRLMEEQGITVSIKNVPSTLLAIHADTKFCKRFIPSSWNLDWSTLHWGAVPYYDLFLALKCQLELSATVKPTYIFIGILAEAFFSVPGHGGFAPINHGVWDPDSNLNRAEVWGTGDEKWQITTETDCAEFTAELICDLTKEGGSYRFCSIEHSIKEIAAIYEEEKGKRVQLEPSGSVEDLRVIAERVKKDMGPQRFWEWIGYFYQLYQLDGTFTMRDLDNQMYPAVKVTSLKEFLRQNEEI